MRVSFSSMGSMCVCVHLLEEKSIGNSLDIGTVLHTEGTPLHLYICIHITVRRHHQICMYTHTSYPHIHTHMYREQVAQGWGVGSSTARNDGLLPSLVYRYRLNTHQQRAPLHAARGAPAK